jgi:hypothetical protein
VDHHTPKAVFVVPVVRVIPVGGGGGANLALQFGQGPRLPKKFLGGSLRFL